MKIGRWFGDTLQFSKDEIEFRLIFYRKMRGTTWRTLTIFKARNWGEFTENDAVERGKLSAV